MSGSYVQDWDDVIEIHHDSEGWWAIDKSWFHHSPTVVYVTKDQLLMHLEEGTATWDA